MDKIALIKGALPIEQMYEAHQKAKNKIIQRRDVDGMFHPSAFGGCTRALWYAYCQTEPKHRIPPKLRNTFDHGHAVHNWQQAELAELFAHYEGDVRFHFDDEVKLRGQYCVSDIPEQYHITGSADGLIRFEIDGVEHRVVYELKTASDASWTKLTKPMVKHIGQASLYAKCLGADVILFQYYNKNNDTSKYFFVERDDNAVEACLDQVRDVFDALDSGDEPEAKYNSWECGSCKYYHECRPEMR